MEAAAAAARVAVARAKGLFTEDIEESIGVSISWLVQFVENLWGGFWLRGEEGQAVTRRDRGVACKLLLLLLLPSKHCDACQSAVLPCAFDLLYCCLCIVCRV